MPHLKIDKLAYGGSGFGRLDGKACFVPFSAPGDIVQIRIERSKSSYSEGGIEELLYSSDHRSTPRCPVFGVCGGCNWQHISYSEQCVQKQAMITDAFWRSARVESEKIKPILRSVPAYGYRQRVQLKVDYSSGRYSLGFHRRNSHDVIDIDHCPIAAEPLNSAIREVRETIGSFKEPSLISQVDLASSADASVGAVFNYCGDSPEILAEHLKRAFVDMTALHSLSIKTGHKKNARLICGLERLKYSLPATEGGDVELHYAPDSFSQVNYAQNRVIVQLLLDYCRMSTPSSILDLYAGNGNFSLPLAGSVREVLGFESAEKSVANALYNADINGIRNARYLCKDSKIGVEELAKKPGQFDLVIMDPPRAGADEVSRQIHKIGASQLIYISCDPMTLGRDLATLKNTGFEVSSVQPVDMFPQTYHLENVVFLKFR